MTSIFRSGSSRRKAETPGKIRIQLKGKNSKVLNSDDEDDPAVDNVDDIGDDDDDSDNLPVAFDNGIPDDLPEGTFIVQPEPVEDSPIKKKREAVVRIDTSVLDNVSCTACGRQVNPYKGGALQKHPVLKVAICKRCEKFLASGEIAKDKDGTDEQCRWCGEGGRLVVCDDCASAFCKACVMRNFNRSEFNNINGQQSWKCYLCNKAPLQGLRENYRKIRDTLKALQEKEKGKTVTLAANPTNNGTQPSEKSAGCKQISKDFSPSSVMKVGNMSGAVSAQKSSSSFEGVRTLTPSSLKSNLEISHMLQASGAIHNVMLGLEDTNVTFDNVFTVVDKLVTATNAFKEMLHVLQSQSQFTIPGNTNIPALRLRCVRALNMGIENYLKSLRTILSGSPHLHENMTQMVYTPDMFQTNINGLDSASSFSASEAFALSRLSANPVIMPMGSNFSLQDHGDLFDSFLAQQGGLASAAASRYMPEVKQEINKRYLKDSTREKFVKEDNGSLLKEFFTPDLESSKQSGKAIQKDFQSANDSTKSANDSTKSATSRVEVTKVYKDGVKGSAEDLKICTKIEKGERLFETNKEVDNRSLIQDEDGSETCDTSGPKSKICKKGYKKSGEQEKTAVEKENFTNATDKMMVASGFSNELNQIELHTDDNVGVGNLSDKLISKETVSSSQMCSGFSEENIAAKFDLVKEFADEILKDGEDKGVTNNKKDSDAKDLVKLGQQVELESDKPSNKVSKTKKLQISSEETAAVSEKLLRGIKKIVEAPKDKADEKFGTTYQDGKSTTVKIKQEKSSVATGAGGDISSSSLLSSDDDVDLATRRQRKKKKEMLNPTEKTLMPARLKQENLRSEEKSKTVGKLATKSNLDNPKMNGKGLNESNSDIDEESTDLSRQSSVRKRKASVFDKDGEEFEKKMKVDSKSGEDTLKKLKPGPKSSKKGSDCDNHSSGENERKDNEDISDGEDEPPVTFFLDTTEVEDQQDVDDDDNAVTKDGSLDTLEDENGCDAGSDADKKTKTKKSPKNQKKNTKDGGDENDGGSSKRKRINNKLPDVKLSDSDSDDGKPKKKKKDDDEDSFKADESSISSIESDLSDSDEAEDSDGSEGVDEDGEKKSKKGKKKSKSKKRKRKCKKGTADDSNEEKDDDEEEEKGKKKKNDKGKRKVKKISSSDEDDEAEEKEEEEDDDDDDDPNSSKAGKRKQIRKVMSNKRLEDSTKAAARSEEKRRKRIAAKQREFNIETITDENNPMDCPITTKLILENGKEEGDEPLIQVSKNLVRKLKPHQVEAVQFMWDCMYESVKRSKKEQGSGCILAHCMGLGKTLSVIAFVHTILSHEKIIKHRTCLVVSPLNTVLNWRNEWSMWLEEEEQLEVWELASCKQNAARAEALKEWQESGGIMIMGYEMYRNLTTGSRCKNKRQKKVFQETLVNPGPDLVICDEGHILKNETSAISKAMNQMRTRRRVVLTGTPLQNNLNEYHCMVSFVKPSLLGTRKEFNNRFISPIQNGQCTDSTPRDVKIMKARAHVLHEMLAGCVQRRDYSALTKFLPPKQEYVISVRLTNIQIELYEKYLEITGQGIDGVFSNKGARLFADYQNLMKIWTHPWVLKLAEIRDELKMKYDDDDSFIDDDSDEDRSFSSSGSSSEDDKGVSDSGGKGSSSKLNTQRGTRRTRAKARRQAGEDSDPEEVIAEWKSKTRTNKFGEDDNKMEESDKSVTKEWWAQYVTEDDKLKLELSNKLHLLFEILRMCEEIGDKVLIFSQSILSLNIIESFLEVVDSKFQLECESLAEEEKQKELFGRSWTKNLDYYRMDGSTSAQNRQLWASNFNDLDNYRARLFLISTRAGGLGINLVAANRVIIFDASWNPSHDVQSIFRVYRFGQIKPCYIYRFLAQGTMEEKIYERQVTKLSLSQRVVDEHQIERHFSANDLKELYNFRPDRWDDGTEKPTLALPKDPLLAEILTANKHCVVSFHEHDSLLENQIEQTLTEEEKKAAWEEYENEKKGIIIRGPGMERTASWPMMAAAQILSREQITATVQALRQQLPDISEDLFHLHVQQALRRQVQIKQEEMRRMEILRLQEMNYLNMIKQQAQQSGLSHAQSLQAMQNMAPWMQIQRLRAMQQSMLMSGGHLGMLPSASMSLLGQALSTTISNKPEEAIDLEDN